MKDSQPGETGCNDSIKYIKADNERFSTDIVHGVPFG